MEQRLEDEEITPLVFLWEPYKPEFWYWEVIETGRRLMMTGGESVRGASYVDIHYTHAFSARSLLPTFCAASNVMNAPLHSRFAFAHRFSLVGQS